MDQRILLETHKLGLHSLQHVGVIFTLFGFLDPQHRYITVPLLEKTEVGSMRHSQVRDTNDICF